MCLRPHTLHPGAIQGKEGIKFCHLATLVQAMASCHSLIKLRGELTGNPLDVKIFEAIDWDLTEQFNMGVNPAYGVPTPTLVSPPKVRREG